MIKIATLEDLLMIDYIGESLHSNFNLYYDVKSNMKNDYVKIFMEGDMGLAYIENHGDYIDLIAIVTQKLHQGKGVATRLLNYIKDYYNLPIMAEVREDNEVAINFYKSQGFEQISVRKKYYDHKVNALVMRWNNE